MDRRFRPYMLMFPALVAASACDFGKACTLIAKPGIRVTIVDAATAGPVDVDVTVVATHGSYTETVTVPATEEVQVAHLAQERAGWYRVEATGSGYDAWVTPLVRVTEDECHVRTVELTARLQKTQ